MEIRGKSCSSTDWAIAIGGAKLHIDMKLNSFLKICCFSLMHSTISVGSPFLFLLHIHLLAGKLVFGTYYLHFRFRFPLQLPSCIKC